MVRLRLVGFFLILALVGCAAPPSHDDSPTASMDGPRLDYAIVIHGGAGSTPRSVSEENRQQYLESLKKALELGRSILEDGGTSLDAVEKVLILLEDDPRFNAGKGAVYNHDGGHEMDASIMDGSDLECGAVAGVTTVKNPIALARKVMENSRHVLFAAEGAERFADEMGVERVTQDYFHTERRYEQWRKRQAGLDSEKESHKGTVGAVALDRNGNLAAATSTGGLTGKQFGRVGDSPVIGAGTYANNATCAISCTGVGEEFIRHSVAHRISALMELKGLTLQEAAEEVIHHVLKPGEGGIIGVGRDGSTAMVFNTGSMFRGVADSTGRFEIGIWE